MITQIKREALYIPVNQAGVLQNIASQDYISCEDRKFLDTIVADIKAAFPNQFITIYLRGSMACGRFLRGISDVDLVVLVPKKGQRDSQQLEEIAALWTERCQSWCELIDISIFALADVMRPENNRLYLNLTLTGLVLYSDGRIPSFPEPVMNAELASRICQQTVDDCVTTLERIHARRCVSYMGMSRGADFLCVWFMRDLLRGLIAFVMEKRRVFSLQPSACCDSFLGEYPEHSSLILRLWNAERNPVSEWEKLESLAEEGLALYRQICYEMKRE